jgi:glyoxylase-like metal-dependent hydrolase (beta-lactamase superfamily II)
MHGLPTRVLTASLLSCLGASLAAQETVRSVDVAAGVFAVLQPQDKRFDDSNAVVIIGERAVMIVDAPVSREAIDTVVEEIRRRTKTPVRYVLNTHWHADHTQGNRLYREAFGDGVTFIGHNSLRQEIPERAARDVRQRIEQYETMIPEAEAQLAKGLGMRGQELSEEQQLRQATAIDQARAWLAENRDVEFVVPQLTYEERLDLDLGGLDVQLLHRRAHTSGDTVVWIPGRAVVATGDTLDDLPYIGHGHPRSWVGWLESLRELPFEKIVPGHGPVFEGRDRLDGVLEFLQALIRHTDTAAAEGTAPEEAVATFDAETWRTRLAGDDAAAQRFFDAVLGEAISRALDEAVAR